VKARLVELPSNTSSPPHCCIVTGRLDAPVVDFGDPTAKAQGPNDPRIYIREGVVEKAARDLLGMVPRAEVDGLREELAASEAERQRLAEIVGGGEELGEAEERMRAALGPAPDHDTAADSGAGKPKE
jgi:hypothetical protein